MGDLILFTFQAFVVLILSYLPCGSDTGNPLVAELGLSPQIHMLKP